MIHAEQWGWFSPTKVKDAAERLGRLLGLLVDIDAERSIEFTSRGSVDQRKLVELQTLAAELCEDLNQDLPLLVSISSLETVSRWKALMPGILVDRGPIPYDDQYHQDENTLKDPYPADWNLTRAITQVRSWFGKCSSNNKRIFIVHGHDEAKKWELKNFLARLNLDPVILHEQDDLGKTIIEKFEYYAAACSFAFVLLTPDDVAPREPNTQEAEWRARQNVIMELGWFMAKFGRQRVIIIQKGHVEIPSDILGVLYLPVRESIEEVSEKIRQRLRTENVIL